MTEKRIAVFFREIEPPEDLFRAVLARIALARRRAALLRLVALGTVMSLSALALILALQYAASEFYASGFYEYASLFVDGVQNGYWQDVLFSLANSLPSLALLLLLAVSLSLWWSMRRAGRNVRIAFVRTA